MLQRRSSPQPASQFGKKSIHDKLQWTGLSGEHFIDTFHATYVWGCNLPPIYDQTKVIQLLAVTQNASFDLGNTLFAKRQQHMKEISVDRVRRFMPRTQRQQTMRRAHQHRQYTRSSSNRRLFLLLLLLLWGRMGWRFDITGLLAPRLTYGSSTLQKVRCVSSTNS